MGGREENPFESAGLEGNLQLSLQELITWRRQNTANPGQEQPVSAGKPWQGQGWRKGPSSLGLRYPWGCSFPISMPPLKHPLNLEGADMLSRLQNLTQSLAAGGMEADGCIGFPNDLAYAVEKTRKPIRKEKSSGRVEGEYLHNSAELWEWWGAGLLRPVVLFWKIPLPPWPGICSLTEQWRRPGGKGDSFLVSWNCLGPLSPPAPCLYITQGYRRELLSRSFSQVRESLRWRP